MPLTGPVGVVGLGAMGSAIASRLAAAGVTVIGYDRSSAAWSRLAGAGVDRASDLEALSRACPVILTVVDSDASLAEIVGIIRAHRRDGTVMAMGTHAPRTCRELAAAAAGSGITFLDAPVSGGRERALRGELSIMGSGDLAAWQALGPVIDLLATRLFYLGSVGNAEGAKLVNNLLTSINLLGVAEGVALAEHLGLDLSELSPVIMASSGASRRFEETLARVLAGDDMSGTRAGLKVLDKDLSLALDSAPDGQELALTGLTRALIRQAMDDGLADRDIEIVVPWMRGRLTSSSELDGQ
jgi:3-hydroxyisobutyrate dehydrogenase-like beta-hydroxyacid dehydrogenase